MEIAKAEESLKAAEICYAQGLYNSSASRAYYAMFQAAQAALEAAGFARLAWSHAGLHATFANELRRRRRLYASTFASDVAIVIDLRHTAAYRDHDLGKRQAMRALNNARGFVNAVKESIFHG
ncbi:MAG: HEPN domain-containing protein [Candidatus Entotheonellia bacterium]